MINKYFRFYSYFIVATVLLLIISCGGISENNSSNTDYSDTLSDLNELNSPAFPEEDQIKTDSTKLIHSFEFHTENNPEYLSENIYGSISGNIITLRVPVYTDRKFLIPTIQYSGKSITPESGKAVNFSDDNVVYTVTAEDGTTAKYKIIIQNRQLMRSVEYIPANKEKIDPDNDEIIGYSVPEFFKDGACSEYTEYYSNGEDGIWFNDDDDIYSMNVYNKAGEIVESYSFNNPGPDGIYHTQDDIYNSYVIHFYDKNGNAVEYIEGISAGMDGIWLTEDDGFSVLVAYEYENKLLSREIHYSDADVISCYYLYSYNQDFRIDAEWKYNGPGPDKEWLTEDDNLETETFYQYDDSGNIIRETTGHDKYGIVSYWYSYSYNTENKIIEKIEYNKEGHDNIWFTGDDIIASRESYEYNRNGRLTLSINSLSPGTDDIWFNSDDNINSYTIRDYTEFTETYTSYYWPDNRIGPDGLWFTADDIPWYKIYILYNVIRNVKKDQEIYIITYGAGNDGIWFTADDVKLNSYMRNRFDPHGNPLGTTYYNGPGNDGVWMTGDDLIDYYTVSVYK
ncbi:MAG: hypothetical protein JXN64_02140 [Spirochaetes bacterium]|nr:hypothetical protein [Spirochaetota bacterium]